MPKMLFVIGVMGVGGAKPGAEILELSQGDGGVGGDARVQGQCRRLLLICCPVGRRNWAPSTRNGNRSARRRSHPDVKHKDYADAMQDVRGAKAGVLEKVRGRSHHARRGGALEARRLERRLRSPGWREDLRAHGRGLRARPCSTRRRSGRACDRKPPSKPIFNGIDLTDWDEKPGWWKVEDGALIAPRAHRRSRAKRPTASSGAVASRW